MEFYYPQPEVYDYSTTLSAPGREEEFDFSLFHQPYASSSTSTSSFVDPRNQYASIAPNDALVWSLDDQTHGLQVLPTHFSNSGETDFYSSGSAYSRSVSDSPMDVFNSSAFGPFLLEPSEGTNSSNGSLSNSPLNLLSSRCPLPTVPFSLPECQLLCDQSPSNQPTHQHQEVNLSAGRRIPKSKKEARSLSPSPYRRDSKGNRCPECSAKFARARDLKRHFRLHTGEKPYPCKSCGESFIRSDARGRHWIANPDCFTAHNGGEI